ncbi:MAG: CheR family methyltransferase [bacterium]
MEKREIENRELDLLLETIYQHYGYDFRHYSKASMKRRVKQFLSKSDCSDIMEMTSKVVSDKSFFALLVQDLSITVTEMFRDPGFYRALRQYVVPYLKTYPFIKVWHAGCATGEEVYSMAILLKEEGFYDRAIMYATDFNDAALQKAKEGIYPLEYIQSYTTNYQKAGGTGSFSEYYYARYDSVIMNKSLKKNITFANHNLVTDSAFGEMHLILCRNVLIYFDKTLQNQVLNLFKESLIHYGFLCLGVKEGLQFSDVVHNFKVIEGRQRIYRKMP